MSTTPRSLIATAFSVLNVFQTGQLIPAPQETFAFTLLNMVVGLWALQSGTIPAVSREVFPLVSGKGGPDNPYTIGPGGDFNTTRPPSQSNITGVSLILGGTSPAVVIPRALFTDDMREMLRIPNQSNSLFTGVFYNPTYAAGLGSIELWPVPNTTLNELILWRKIQLAAFTSLTQSVALPDGYDIGLSGSLMQLLAEPFGAAVPPVWDAMTRNALRLIKRANFKMSDLPQDPAWTHDRQGGYNINTGQPS